MCCFLGLNFVRRSFLWVLHLFFSGNSPDPKSTETPNSTRHVLINGLYLQEGRGSPWCLRENCVCPSEINPENFLLIDMVFYGEIRGSILRSFMFWVVCGTSPPPSTLGKHPRLRAIVELPTQRGLCYLWDPLSSKSTAGGKKCPAPQSKHHHPKVESTRDWFWSQKRETWQDFPATHSCRDNHEGLLDWLPARLHSCLRNHSEFVAGDKQMMKALVSRRKL